MPVAQRCIGDSAERIEPWQEENSGKVRKESAVGLTLPIVKPPVAVPVIELMLK